MTNLTTKETSFVGRFRQRYSLRLHMTLILLATVSAGLLATRMMLALHLHNVMVRYPLAVVFAYLTFFIFVKLWLKFVAPSAAARAGQRTSGSGFNIFTGSSSSGSSGGSTSTGSSFRGGGGNFGGGGASGSFDAVPIPLTDSGAEIASVAQDAGSSVVEATGDVAKGAAGGLVEGAASAFDDEKGCLVAIVLLAVAAVIFGAGLYLIYEAPFILSEAAFQAILAGALVRGARRIEQGDWMGSVFRATWIPFVLTLLLSLLAGYLLHHYFPGVTRISELFHHFRGK